VKLLAIDTATEQCSVALLHDGQVLERCVPTSRGHTELVLPMVRELLSESGFSLQQLDAIAFGRGPGSFTGVRIAIGVAQGLAYALCLPVLPISNLAAVAQQAAPYLPVGAHVLVCMDARMAEIYTGLFVVADDGLMRVVGEERLLPPEQLNLNIVVPKMGLGTGFHAYPVLRARYARLPIDEQALPRARDVAHLAANDFAAGLAVAPEYASPVYLRDQVVQIKTL
jgi:tRNA threonylcarbamoyladenosine biosynthesis protein TsaB